MSAWRLAALLGLGTALAPSAAAANAADGMTVEATYGHMPEEQVTALLNARMPEVNRCFREASERLWFLAGAMALRGRVAGDGSVKSITVLRSTLGSHQVERCISDALRTLKLPPPQGGDGEFICPLEFKPSERARAVQSWPEERVAADLWGHRGEVAACLKKRRLPLQVTLYIGPGGRVATAGLAAAEALDERVATCLLARITAWQLPDPLGQLAKASYTFR